MVRARKITRNSRGLSSVFASVLAMVFVFTSGLLVISPATAASAPITVELQESVDAGHKIPAREVQLVTDTGVVREIGTTGFDGRYVFANAVDTETYSIHVETVAPYESVGTAFGRQDEVLVTSTSMVIGLVPVAGTLSGAISNWDTSLMDGLSTTSGTNMHLFRFDTVSGDWDPVDFDNHFLYHDWFRISGVTDTANYAIFFETLESSNFYWTSSDGLPVSRGAGMYVEVGVAGDPLANVDVGPVSLVESGRLSGAVLSHGAVVPDGFVIALSDPPTPQDQALIEFVLTDAATGEWSVKVPVGRDFQLVAGDQNGDYYPLYWKDDFCGCAVDTVSVLAGATTANLNFDLTEIASSVTFDVYLSELDLANLPSELDLAGVRMHLYRPVTGGWQEVDSYDSNVVGLGYLVGQTTGSYRFRFSRGSDWLPFTRYTDNARTDLSVPATCFLDVGGTALGDKLDYDFLLDTVSTSPSCGPEPAPVVPSNGGSGTTPPRSTGPSSSFSSVVTPSQTPTPTPTPTSTPTFSPSPSPSATSPTPATQSPSPQVLDANAAGSFDLAWLCWLLAVLAVLGIAVVGFVILRRR